MNNQEKLQVVKDLQLTYSHIHFRNNLDESDMKKLLDTKPKSIYIEHEETEIDHYEEVSFYLKNGEILQNSVKQTHLTKTEQGRFTDIGESIKESIINNGISDFIDFIILYVQRFINGKELNFVTIIDIN